MIEEMLLGNELEKMLRDSFANYVVQTAMDFADAQTKGRLVDATRPILPLIKQTPHGRRIASKILGGDAQGRGTGNNDNLLASFSGGRANSRRNVQIVGGGFNGIRTPNGYGSNETPIENMTPAASAPYGMMHHLASGANESTINMYSAHNYPNGLGQNGYSGFINGSVGGSSNML